MPLDLTRVRALYPHSDTQIYLNHAAISPYSTPVVQALEAFMTDRHTGEIEIYHKLQPRIQHLRAALAQRVGRAPEQIAFVGNTSAGLNLLTSGLDWRAGDRILLNPLEFPSNVYPFLNLQRLGVIIDWVQPRDMYLHLDDFAAALTPQTRLLSISAVQFLTGQRHDLGALGEMCRANDTLFCVDGIQALGAHWFDLATLKIDFLASGGHKWLMGAQGQGFVAMSPELLQYLQSPQVGWLSVQNAWDMLDYQLELRPDAARYELGTFNALGLTALAAALEVFGRFESADITAQILDLSAYLVTELRARGLDLITPEAASERLGIVTFRHPEANRLQQGLLAAGITVSARENSYVRFSPHYYNTQTELAEALSVLDSLL
ncbi:MAG: aminotransferase class V-fold PLP-dependent enzyme [Candidatus Sericytochromatia bacterium]